MLQSQKLSYKWLSLYRVRKVIPNKGTYFLEEFDGTELASTYFSNHLKKFIQRNKFYMLITTDTDINNSSFTNSSTDSINNKPLILDNPMVRRSVQIQENAQIQEGIVLLSIPRPRRFKIVPLLLTNKQRRKYVRYKEDNKGNII